MKTTTEICMELDPRGEVLMNGKAAEAMKLYAEQAVKEVLKQYYTWNHIAMMKGGITKSVSDIALEVMKDLK